MRSVIPVSCISYLPMPAEAERSVRSAQVPKVKQEGAYENLFFRSRLFRANCAVLYGHVMSWRNRAGFGRIK